MIQPLPDLSKVCFQRNFTPVEFYVTRNFPELNWIELNFFNSRARKITKVSFEMYNKIIMTTASKKVLSSIYFLRNAKYVSTFFLSLYRPAKMYVKSNIRKLSNM
jgi:hypothetical protein